MRKTNTLVYIVQIGDAPVSGSGREVRTVSNREGWKKVLSGTDYQISFPNWNSQATTHPQPEKDLRFIFFGESKTEFLDCRIKVSSMPGCTILKRD